MTEYQKHTTHTDALDTLGSVIDETQKRDAIHLAVFPVEAATIIYPGADVKLGDDGLAYPAMFAADGVGIADPFLKQRLHQGDWFWLVVYPRQISSLRHVWEHDAFPVSGETQAVPVAEVRDLMKEAEIWLRDFVSKSDWPHHFEDFIDQATSGRGYIVAGNDSYGEIPAEFWHHLSNFTGTFYDSDREPSSFSCAC